MLKKSVATLVGSLLIAGSAFAQTANDTTDDLSSTDKKHIEALFNAQQPVEDYEGQGGATTLTREDIAAYRSESGWGKAFKEMQADGHFEGYKNFGEVVSEQNSKHGRTVSGEAATKAERHDGIGNSKAQKLQKSHRVSRVNRPNRPHRPKRPKIR